MTIEEYRKDYPVIYQKAINMFAKNARYYPNYNSRNKGHYIILKSGECPDGNPFSDSLSSHDSAKLFKKFINYKAELLEVLRNKKPNHTIKKAHEMKNDL